MVAAQQQGKGRLIRSFCRLKANETRDNRIMVPKLSVTVITYNQAHLVGEALDSILSDLPPSTELIVSDDASTDGAQEILLDYARRYPDVIRLNLNEKNLGLHANASLAFSLARGEYIAILAGDDIVLPGKFTAQMDFLNQHPDVILCYHDTEVFSDNGSFPSYLFSDRHGLKSGDIRTVIRYGSFFSANTVMLRRKSLPPHNLVNGLTYSGDTFMFVECLEQGGRIDFVPGTYLRYRYHVGNISAVKRRKIEDEKRQEIALLYARFPQYAGAIRGRHADLLFIEAVRALQQGAWLDGLSKLMKSVVVSRGIWAAPIMAAREVLWRLRIRHNAVRPG